MPYITLKQRKGKVYYEDSQPNGNKPVIFFAHGLLWSCRMWDEQVKVLQKNFRCIRMDFRGQGLSKISKSGYDMDSLTQDVIDLLDHLKVNQYHFVGLSMGGFVGQRLALAHPQRLQKLILMNTSADPEPTENLAKYRLLMKVASVLGAKAVMSQLVHVMHGQTFLQQAKKDKHAKARLKLFKRIMSQNKRRAIKKITLGVIEREGVHERIKDIKQPTLILAGDEDVATTIVKAQRIHMQIDGSKLAILSQTGHTSSMEQPEKVTQHISDFLKIG